MDQDGEFSTFILVWATTVASLCYCHVISKIFTTKSMSRFLSILPVNLLFLVLPLCLSSILLGATTCFLVAWLANFKLILFAFNKGPLFSNPPLPLSQFLLLACFPVKVRHAETSSKHTSYMSTILVRVIFLALLVITVRYEKYIHHEIKLSFLGLRIALTLELLLAVSAALSRPFLSPQLEIQQPFDNFHMSTSVQNYWGKRWNLVVSDILKLTIYEPVRSVSARYISDKNTWASTPAVMAAFMVSGLMHELVFYNFTKEMPSGYLICYFLVHGVAVSVEIVIKKKFGGNIKVPGIVSWQLAMAFMGCTGSLLFIQPVLAAKCDLRTCKEAMAFLESVFTSRLVDPADLHCPLL